MTYPFAGLGGVSVGKQVSGQRVYDINVDGVAHYGLYSDWIEDLRRLAGDQIVADMSCGADAYLQMWETAVGITPTGCRAPGLIDGLPNGLTVEEVLRQAGQPQRRQASTFAYCLTGGGTRVIRFNADGRLAARAGAAAAPTGPLPATGSSPRAGLALAAAALLLAVTRRTLIPTAAAGRSPVAHGRRPASRLRQQTTEARPQ